MPYSEMKMLNFYRRASSEWKRKNYIDTKTHKITIDSSLIWDIPWDMVNNDPVRHKNCRHSQDLFEMYHMVPPFCYDCWKVVVRPRTHAELISLRNLQREMATEDPDVWCKCGIELRTYVPGLYGGYFYTNSKEDGLKRLQQVRKRIKYNTTIGDVPVYLKRYCTEFEKELGDSAKYEMPESAEKLQEFYLSHMAEIDFPCQQPKLIKLEVYQGWIDFGWKFGTPEDRKEIEEIYNDGKPLYPIPRTYEE